MKLESGFRNQPAFGIKLAVPHNVHEETLASFKGFAEKVNKKVGLEYSSSKNPERFCTEEQAESCLTSFLTGVYRSIAKHNANPLKHSTHDGMVLINKIGFEPDRKGLWNTLLSIGTEKEKPTVKHSDESTDDLIAKIHDHLINEAFEEESKSSNPKEYLLDAFQKIQPEKVERY